MMGSGTGLGQDSTVVDMILALGGSVPVGSGTGLVQDRTLQALLTAIEGLGPGSSPFPTVIVVTDSNYALTNNTNNCVVGFQGLTADRTFTPPTDPAVGQSVTICDLDGTGNRIFWQSDVAHPTIGYKQRGSVYLLNKYSLGESFVIYSAAFECVTFRWNGTVWSMEALIQNSNGLTPP
jgi:hypothetical protein